MDLTNLISFWSLSEAGGTNVTRADSHGSNPLGDPFDTPSTTGLVYPLAANCVRSTWNGFYHTSNASLQLGNIDFCICAWVKLSSKDGPMSIAQKGYNESESNDVAFMLTYSDAADRFGLTIYGSAAHGDAVSVWSDASPTIGVWYFIVAWYDSANDAVKISVNNATPGSNTQTLGAYVETGEFDIGFADGSTGFFLDGVVGPVSFWKRLLTDEERTYLYNSGAGRTYAEMAGTSASPSVSPSVSPSRSASISPSRSPSVSASRSESPSLSPSPSASYSMSPSLSASQSPTYSPSMSPSRSPSVSASASPSASAPYEDVHITTDPINITAHNLIVAYFSHDAGATITDVQDTATNTYLLGGTVTAADGTKLYAYYCYNCRGHATNVITATLDDVVGNRAYAIEQYAGILSSKNPLRDVKSTVGTGAAVSSPVLRVDPAGGVLTAFVVAANSVTAVGAGFFGDIFTITGDATPHYCDEYAVTSVDQAALATVDSGNWTILALSFGTAIVASGVVTGGDVRSGMTIEAPPVEHTAGDLIVVDLFHDAGLGFVNSVQDLAGNEYHIAVGRTNPNGSRMYQYYAWNCKGFPSNIVTAYLTGACTYRTIAVRQISGVRVSSNPLMGNGQGGGSGTAMTTAAVVPITEEEGVIAAFGVSDAYITSVGVGYAGTLFAITGDANQHWVEETRVTTVSSYATASCASSTWNIIAASYAGQEVISPSVSPSVSASASMSPTASASRSPSRSPSRSASISASASMSPSYSPSRSPSVSPSISPSASPSAAPPAPISTVTYPLYQVLLNGNWVDITDDVIEERVSMTYGITGVGPTDLVASTGQCSFTLRNDAQPGKALGRYSPGHASCVSGWTYGIRFRLLFYFIGQYYPRFYGKVRVIAPESGVHGARRVKVTVYDMMRDLAETDIREIDIQVNKTEAEIITAVLDAMPATSQPVYRFIDAGADTFPYALDDIGPGRKALTIIADMARSSFGTAVYNSNGNFVYKSRYSRMDAQRWVPPFTGDYMDLIVESDQSSVYNLVNVTIHPKTIDAEATTVLFRLTGSVPFVAPGDTVELWGSYADPNNTQRLIGGLDAVTTLVPYTDYAGNSLPDGTGLDLTGDLSIVVTAFATAAKFEITNNGNLSIYLVPDYSSEPLLQLRGRGVYDLGPQTFSKGSDQPYGTRPMNVDMPYQNNPYIAQDAATYIESLYNDPSPRLKELSFMALNDTLRLVALAIEPGDIITVTEEVTGLASVDAVVQSVTIEVAEKQITCRLLLAPTIAFNFWQWGVTGRSEWGINTIYGF